MKKLEHAKWFHDQIHIGTSFVFAIQTILLGSYSTASEMEHLKEVQTSENA